MHLGLVTFLAFRKLLYHPWLLVKISLEGRQKRYFATVFHGQGRPTQRRDHVMVLQVAHGTLPMKVNLDGLTLQATLGFERHFHLGKDNEQQHLFSVCFGSFQIHNSPT